MAQARRRFFSQPAGGPQGLSTTSGRPAFVARVGCTIAFAVLLVAPAHALRVVSWNLLQYPGSNITPRQPHFRTVMGAIDADVLIAQELNSAAGRDSFLNNVLNVVQPGLWSASSWASVGAGEGGAIFYQPSRVLVSNVGTFATSGPRAVLQSLVRAVGYSSNAAWFRLYSFHLKAGTSSTPPADSTRRRLECTDIRNTLNTVNQSFVGPNFVIGGDGNFQGAFEGGYIRLTESQDDDDGRAKDPVHLPGTWNNNLSYAIHHTQSPCVSGCPGSGGGMDDRFDFLLSSYSLADGVGLDVIDYFAYGNDGFHFNQAINSGGNAAVSAAVANALVAASDHIPVVMVLQLPPKVVAASMIDFGTALEGVTLIRPLTVTNGAQQPADALDYSLSAPFGFTAPAGSFSVTTGANAHTIGMDTGSFGAKSGTLTIASDDPDSSSKPVQLSGVVLRHADPSLDSLASLHAAALDLGNRPVGEFPDSAVRVHNRGYDAFQARLSVNSATITGADGRFSIVGGFTGALLGETGKSYTIHFDDAGATLDSTYEATLTLTSADEPQPGATSAPDLIVSLRARPATSPTSTPRDERPTALRFDPPRPNPVGAETWLAFDLPGERSVVLEVFDLSGRRVATPAAGVFEAGRHHVRWSVRDPSGKRLPAGLYFARFRTAGANLMQRIVVLP